MSDESHAPPSDGRLCPQSRLARHYSRRRVVAGVGALALGGGALVAGTRDAAAQVSVESLQVRDARLEGEQVDPVVDVSIAYAFEVPDAEQVVVELLVGESVIADEAMRTRSEELESDTDLSGRVARSEAWSMADFAPASGEQVAHDVRVSLRLVVETAGGESVTATAEDTAEIVVTNPSAGSAQIGGEGVIRDSK